MNAATQIDLAVTKNLEETKNMRSTATQIYDAISLTDVRRLRVLASAGLPLDIDSSKRTVLIEALCSFGDSNQVLEMVETLLASGANVHAVDSRNGMTPLHYACELYMPKCSELLISRGANVNAMDQNGNTPLSTCVFYWQKGLDNIRCLVRHGADVNTCNLHGVSPLSLARSMGNVEVVKLLCAK